MPLHATWAACAASIARSLTATTPDLADWMFGAAREAGAIGQGGWFRLGAQGLGGVAFLSSQGADHRYRAVPPAGIDPAALPETPPVVRGLLRREAEAFLRDARVLADGREIRINGGRIPIEPSADAAAAAAGVAAMLGDALALWEPQAVAGMLRDVALEFLRGSGRDERGALEAATARIGGLRTRNGAHAPLWALAQLRAEGGAGLLGTPVLFKLFDPFGRGADAEGAVQKAVEDLVAAGMGDALAEVAAGWLRRAEAARDRALDSRSIVAHGAALHAAAGDAWASGAVSRALGQPAVAASDLALRATHALVADAINLGSGTVLLRHQAQIAAEGAGKADEIIEEGWFYPRALRGSLLPPT